MADGAEGRVPPSDLDAEGAVLSAILLEPDSFDRVQELLQPAHFYADANRRIFEAVVDLNSNGRPIDIVSVAGHLRDKDRLQQIGGSPYLARLSDAIPAVAHVEAHAQRIREKWRLRQLIATCRQIAVEGYADVGDVPMWIQDAEARIYTTVQHERADETMSTLGEAAVATLTAAQAQAARGRKGITGYSTGLGRLDRQIDGLQPGCLYTLAARPGMGKTGLAMQIAVNIAQGAAERPVPRWL
jgi:replicative DNA helicase